MPPNGHIRATGNEGRAGLTVIRQFSGPLVAVVVTTRTKGVQVYQRNLNNRSLRHALLLGAASAVALGLSTPASAQVDCKANPNDPSCKKSVETVVVTGSLIPTTNLTTTSPVTEITAADVHTQGVTRIEDLVNQLPQAFADQNATVSNGATGTATVDLRGLGADRTLVLIDGKRMPYGSPDDTAADLNEIPTMMVDRVEVLTGGASATYGSDAIAGVVNFIMKKDFQGFQIDAQYDTFQHNNSYDGVGNLRKVIAARAAGNPSQFQLPPDSVWDGAGVNINAMMGISSADGKGNITAYFSYRNNQPVLQARRDYSACTVSHAATTPGGDFGCGGSYTSYPGYFYPLQGPYAFTGLTLNKTTFAPQAWTPNNIYNYGPLNYYQRSDTRYSFGAFGHYDINSHVEVYTQLMFTDYSTVGQIAPTGNFFAVNTLNCGNPLLSGAQASAFGCSAADIAANNNVGIYMGRRNVEGGGRQDTLGYQSYRAVIGFKGDLTQGWHYDVSGQYSRVQLSEVYLHDFSKTRLARALDVVSVGGVPTCQSVVDGSDPNCVPWDIFSPGGVTQAALNYLEIPLVQEGYTTLQDLNGLVTGDLGQYGIQSPWAKSPATIALGAEYRSNSLSITPDTSYQTFDGAGQGGPLLPLNGTTSVTDLYTELQAPLVEDAPLAQLISLDVGYRYSTYSSSVTTNTYKVSGDWAPTDDVRFRASYQRAVRAANVVELFTAQGFNLFDMPNGDPCANGGYATLAQCVATGVPAANYGSNFLKNPADQYNQQTGGNPNVSPEKSDTWTIGAVFTPTFFDGFTASIDYFDIRVQNLISTTGALNVIAACYQGNVASECARIHRSATGSLWTGGGFVENLNTNIGGLKTTGIDVSATYQMDLSDVGLENDGSLTFELVGTYLNQLVTNTGVSGQAPYDCAGYYGNQCGTPNPAWRHRFRVSWLTPWDNIAVIGTWRYYGSVDTFGGNPKSIDYTLDAQSYFDLASNIPLASNTTLRLGVNNVLDSDPPITHVVGTTGNGNTYPQTYDAMGRYLFADIQINL